MYKTAALHNLGCKVNSYELEAAAQLLKNRGFTLVPFAPGADIYVINTCTVTNIADRKSRQMLHRARSMNPDALVIAMGCYAQTDAALLAKDEAVDVVLGNNRKNELADIIDEWEKNRERKEYVDDLSHGCAYEEMHLSESGEHIRGFLKVQDGCDRFCSYCVIPYARGRVRSRKPEDAVAEAEKLAAAGCREVILSGIHLSSYGKDLFGQTTLLDLILRMHAVDGIERIRLGSLEPGIITEEFVRTLAGLPKICPHFHLSLQSGCDRTLRAMNRQYTAAEYREKCALLRTFFDTPSLTTDVITGFPGETEEDFEESFRFVEEIGFFETHIFPYSRRKGTRADRMDGQLTEAVKKERAARLIALNETAHRAAMRRAVGAPAEVLIEEQQEIGGSLYWVGHTPRYEKTAVRSAENLRNRIIRVQPKELIDVQAACILLAFEIQ